MTTIVPDTLSLDTIVRQHPDQISTDMDGETVMMNIESGAYFGLNAVGSDVWDQMATPTSIADICAGVTTRFEVDPATCQADVLALVADLHQRNLVQLV